MQSTRPTVNTVSFHPAGLFVCTQTTGLPVVSWLSYCISLFLSHLMTAYKISFMICGI